MQVLILNGANLNVLGRRDAAIYGGLSLNELESRIYEWAHALDISARCRQTNSEGEFIEWIHDAYDNVDGLEVQMTKRGLMRDVGERISGRVQFEADVLPYVEWERLAAGSAELVPTSGIVAAVRAIKDDEEVAMLQKAARIADRALEALTAETWVGRSEKEVAWRLHELCHAHGADDIAFESIVAAGPRGAMPPGRPTA